MKPSPPRCTGLVTPGHVGADVWRLHRLTKGGLSRGDAVMSVGADRLVGAILVGEASDALWYLGLIAGATPLGAMRDDLAFGRSFAAAA